MRNTFRIPTPGSSRPAEVLASTLTARKVSGLSAGQAIRPSLTPHHPPARRQRRDSTASGRPAVRPVTTAPPTIAHRGPLPRQARHSRHPAHPTNTADRQPSSTTDHPIKRSHSNTPSGKARHLSELWIWPKQLTETGTDQSAGLRVLGCWPHSVVSRPPGSPRSVKRARVQVDGARPGLRLLSSAGRRAA